MLLVFLLLLKLLLPISYSYNIIPVRQSSFLDNSLPSNAGKGFGHRNADTFFSEDGESILNDIEDESEMEEKGLQKRALFEGSLMASAPHSNLITNEVDLTNEIKKLGVVRIENVLDTAMVFKLRDFVCSELKQCIEIAAKENTKHSSLFSSSLSADNRWDLKLPMNDIVKEALQSILKKGQPLGDMLTEAVGEEAALFELASFVTVPGAGRQVIHSDTLWTKKPVLFTTTIALQDVSEDMGPTVFLPGSHTKAVHKKFDNAATCDQLLATYPHVLSTLTSGSASSYDSRLLHCGGANNSNDRTRMLFYFTFTNPDGVDDDDDSWNVASLRDEYKGCYRLLDFR